MLRRGGGGECGDRGRLADGSLANVAGVREFVGGSGEQRLRGLAGEKAKKEFGSPVTPARLYSSAVKAKTLERQELAVLEQIPGRTVAGTAALAAVKVDIAEVGSAITAWDQGKPASFVQILKRYLNDGRAKSAFAVAGANHCG